MRITPPPPRRHTTAAHTHALTPLPLTPLPLTPRRSHRRRGPAVRRPHRTVITAPGCSCVHASIKLLRLPSVVEATSARVPPHRQLMHPVAASPCVYDPAHPSVFGAVLITGYLAAVCANVRGRSLSLLLFPCTSPCCCWPTCAIRLRAIRTAVSDERSRGVPVRTPQSAPRGLLARGRAHRGRRVLVHDGTILAVVHALNSSHSGPDHSGARLPRLNAAPRADQLPRALGL